MNAPDSVRLLSDYAFIIIPCVVVGEQLGAPVPAVPLLLGFGALAAQGGSSILLMMATLAVVALAVDFGWYEFGRLRGVLVLRRLCRLTWEPDSCVHRAQDVFTRFGVRAMLVSKFVPGLTTILPPLAGIFAVGRVQFALYELAGVWIWSGLWMGLGYVFSDAVALIAGRVASFGANVAIVVGTALAGYLLFKYVRRWLFLRTLRTARVSPEELKRRLDAGEDITILDVRSRLEVAALPHAIPGSRWVAAEEIDARDPKIAHARELVVYCT